MAVSVPEAVMKETKKCSGNFACLETGKCKCEVEYIVGERILFLRDRKAVNCPYCLAFGDRQVCRCPTHYAIHAARIGGNARNCSAHGQAQCNLNRILLP